MSRVRKCNEALGESCVQLQPLPLDKRMCFGSEDPEICTLFYSLPYQTKDVTVHGFWPDAG
ncbi:hypothetical protein XYCOK13_38270 [Xylanibacillus composti]|uniref:Uncharacterized protein n=1 Tax=Xylanibacillus composti TaxID=1572762 RepID=A0A8J4H8M7_9BACL|nr:hypothetical protein XYCOK13_38270 [Xylanibacillus composti]